MALDPLAARLDELLREGWIVSSRISASMRRRLDTLFRVGALVDVKAGGGKRTEVRDEKAVRRWIELNYPSGLHGTEPGLPPRAESVANFANSKKGRPLRIRPVFVRGFGDATLERGAGSLPLAQLTQEFRLVGVPVEPDDPWQLDGVLALVENLELFVHVEQVVDGIDAALWTAGRLDEKVLAWLAAMPAVQVVHVGDFDPVGLDEYLRVKSALGDRARLFVPADLEERLTRYGNAKLLRKSARVLERVRRSADPACRTVLDVIDRHGKGLEQEALLIVEPTHHHP